jgi:exopolysaccharide biosynthesis polyprenyl glycosylphosphotransferase
MIHTKNASYTALLVAGDLVAYFFSLVIALTVRYGAMPGRALIYVHLSSFSILFIFFLFINFSAGLYNKRSLLSPSRIPWLLARSQAIAVLISVAFFYFAPVSITPRANLFLYAVVSTIALCLWRLVIFPVISTARSQKAILVAVNNGEIRELYEEINNRSRYGMSFIKKLEPGQSTEAIVASMKNLVQTTGASILVIDLHDKIIESAMPFLYSLIFSGVQVIDAAKLYEGIFDRVPLSMVGERWLVENTGTSAVGRSVYDVVKRVMDIVGAIVLGLISLIFYPFVYLAIKLDDKGPLFIEQNRIGKNGKPVKTLKFRSMAAIDGSSHDDGGSYVKNDVVGGTNKNKNSTLVAQNSAPAGKTKLKVTRVGKFIRLTRIDELPQLWNVLRGDISFVGPRPELPALVAIYEKEIPYYNARHLIQPGLTGWAQIYHANHPHHAVAVNDTRDKLSYDLYYLKHRSFSLDMKIALQTFRALLSRRGV